MEQKKISRKSFSDKIKEIEHLNLVEFLDKSITLNELILRESGLKKLSNFEMILFDYLCSKVNTEKEILDSFSTRNGYKTICLSIKKYGKLVITPCSKEHLDDNSILIKYTQINNNKYEELLAINQNSELEQEIDNYFKQLPKDIFQKQIKSLIFIFDHMAPIIYFSDDLTYTNFYNLGDTPNNYNDFCIKKELNNFLLQDDLSNRQKEFLYCLFSLNEIGLPIFFEEVNSSQINYTSIKLYLKNKEQYYLKILNEQESSSEKNISLFSLAAIIKKLHTKVKTDYLIYRNINGINLDKRIVVGCPIQLIENIPPALVNNINLYLNNFGLTINKNDSTDKLDILFKKLFTDHLFSPINQDKFTSVIEELLNLILEVSVEILNSDLAMTRTYGDYSKFNLAQKNKQFDDIMSWPQSEYICHVVPSNNFKSKLPLDLVGKIVKAVSARMKFNSWHYTAGNFYQTTFVPDEKTFYFPPVLSDIAADCQYHHQGHIFCSVAHSIRAPEPIKINNYNHDSFIDIRYMRASGKPYSQDDLIMAKSISRISRIIYQSLLYVINSKSLNYQFSFGRNEWFNIIYKTI